MNGWIKIHRKILENPIVFKDADHVAVWIYLLLNAVRREKDALFGGVKITLHQGQLITGRKKIADVLKISESKVDRILKAFKSEQQIEQQTSNRNRLITVLNWSSYQESEPQTEQQVNINRTTDEQQVNTNGEVENINNNICSPEPNAKERMAELKQNFELIYKIYPKKRGKAGAFTIYKGWLKGRNIDGENIRLTNKQMYYAVASYVSQLEQSGTELEYYKNFDTFMRKPILDYVEGNYE